MQLPMRLRGPLAIAALAPLAVLLAVCGDATLPTPPTAGRLRPEVAPSGAPQLLVTALDSGACVDISGAGTEPGDPGKPAILYSCHGGANQQLRFTSTGEVKLYDNMCLDVSGAQGNDGDAVTMWTCHGGANQQWRYTAAGQVVGMNGKCLDVPGLNTTPGTRLVIWSCNGGQNQRWELRNVGSPRQTCGVSFTAVLTNEDQLLAAYNIPATTDTVHVCETWTGSDYVMRETTVGRAPNGFVDPDSARTVAYSGGQISGVAADGGAVHEPVEAGATAFDFMRVDDATRQASYDDPYWAVYSGGGCANSAEIICTSGPAYSRAPSGSAPSSNAAASDTTRDKFTKHGLKRRGVRALVDGAEEVGRSANGGRQFRTKRGDAEVTLTLDKDTELLVGEETRTPKGITKATHTWKKHKHGGYAREHSVIESVEQFRGREVRSRTVTTILSLDLNTAEPSAVPVPSASPSRTPR